MILPLLSFFGTAAATATMPVDMDFATWAELHGKTYATVEETFYRRYVFDANRAAIADRNSQQSSVVLGLNRFADLSPAEFRGRYLGGFRGTSVRPEGAPKIFNADRMHVEDLPMAVDWTTKGAVTAVKNQGQCGSCWAFSTTGSVEGAWFLATGELVSLSEQQLVDCSGPQGNQGCNGGLMDQAFEYIIANGGICGEAAYSYTAAQGSCAAANCTAVAKIHAYADVVQNSTTALMAAVANQPVSVAVEADGLDWQFYFGGIVTDSCGTNLDHGVLVVGYGVAETQEFWKVKNSWGADWGEAGYIRLGRGDAAKPSGECGILLSASYPIVA